MVNDGYHYAVMLKIDCRRWSSEGRITQLYRQSLQKMRSVNFVVKRSSSFIIDKLNGVILCRTWSFFVPTHSRFIAVGAGAFNASCIPEPGPNDGSTVGVFILMIRKQSRIYTARPGPVRIQPNKISNQCLQTHTLRVQISSKSKNKWE